MGKTEIKVERVIRLQASNVKRLEAVDITPDEHCQVIAGQNGAGKSSVLDCIAMALGGKDRAPAEPIRRGQERAEIVLDLGDITVKRIFTEKTTRVEVTSSDGAKYPSPQALLDELTGRLSFDPCEFQNMRPPERTKLIQELSGIDYDKLNAERDQAYSDRRAANSELKAAVARLSAVPEDKGAPTEEVSISELAAELEDAEKVNRGNQEKRACVHKMEADIEADNREIDRIKDSISGLQEQLEELQKGLAISSQGLKKHEKEVATLQDVDTASIRERIAGAEDINRQVRVQKERVKRAEETETRKAEHERLDKMIRDIDKKKAKALAEAKFPVEGLGLNEGDVTFNDMPFDQCSCAERLRVSMAMGINLNPKLKVLLIRSGNDMDDNTLALAMDMAREHGFQCWIEKINPGQVPAIHIEEGKVKEKP